MRRRTVGKQLLAAATLALAGCAGRRATSRNGPSTTTSEVQPRVSVSVSPSSDEDSPVDFGIEVARDDRSESEIATLRLSVENTSDERVMPAVETGVPAPFGVLSAEPVDDDGPEFQLWSEAYAESEYVFTQDRAVTGRTMQTLLVGLEPGERVEETYAIRPDVGGLRDGLRDGEYRVTTYDGNGLMIDGVERTVTLTVESPS